MNATFMMIFIIVFFVIGCSEKVVYKEVKTPIKCDIAITKRPALSLNENFLQDLANLLIYVETLERDLNFCVNGSD